MGEEKRKITLPQLDEIWKAASSKWGDPGARTPTPDPRFESLRHLLNEIEELFDAEKADHLDLGGIVVGDSVSARKRPKKKITKKKARRRLVTDDEDDEFEGLDGDEEIPF